MGFKPSGFTDEMKVSMPRYSKPALGAIIDEHILMRVSGMQNRGILNQVDIAYYDEFERAYFEDVLKETYVKNYKLLPCKLFNFSIDEL